MGLKIEEKASQETQTYLEETNPHFEAVNTAFEAFEKDPSEANRNALKKAKDDYKSVRETVKAAAVKNLTEAEAQAKAAKEATDKAVEEFRKKEPTLPANSPLSKDRVAQLKEYALKNGLSEKDFNDLVQYDHNLLLSDRQALAAQRDLEAKEWAAQVDKDPDLGGNNKAQADRLIDALLDAKMDKETREKFNSSHEAKNPGFRKFLLSIAKGMEPAELKLGDLGRQESNQGAGPESEFSQTAKDAKARGVGVAR